MTNQGQQSAPAITPELRDHATRPRNLGELEAPDAIGAYEHDCGDRITVHLNVRDGVIQQIRYLPQSCLQTLACISAASEMVEGRSPLAARRAVNPESISAALGGLPPSQMHCAEIASRAIWAAVDDWITTRREPWRKLYR